MIVEDKIAQKLEATGLWRRAAARWLDVMQSHALTDQQCNWVCQRRKYCFSRVTPVVPSEKLDIAAIAKAVKAAEKRMGLSQHDRADTGQKYRDFRVMCSPDDDTAVCFSEASAEDVLTHTCGIVPDNESEEVFGRK